MEHQRNVTFASNARDDPGAGATRRGVDGLMFALAANAPMRVALLKFFFIQRNVDLILHPNPSRRWISPRPAGKSMPTERSATAEMSTTPTQAVVTVTLTINGAPHTLEVETSMLDALRESVGLTGPKKGCSQRAIREDAVTRPSAGFDATCS